MSLFPVNDASDSNFVCLPNGNHKTRKYKDGKLKDIHFTLNGNDQEMLLTRNDVCNVTTNSSFTTIIK